MSEIEQDGIGFIKYAGELVPHGVIDAGAAGMALTGLDETLRFFNEKQSPGFATLEYGIPVRTEAGSWIATVLIIGGGAFALSYLKKAGEKMAENDFKDIGFGDVLKKSMSAIQALLKLTKHTRISRGWEMEGIAWRDNGNEIGIPNSRGEILYVSAEFFQWYSSLPPRLINKLVMAVRSGRSLSVGVRNDGGYEVVTVDEADKLLFAEDQPEIEDEFLFPELEHGSRVKLEGKLIRGNEASNSAGLEYQGHILNCHPEYGNIRQFKSALFLRCVVEGTVSRLTKQRLIAEKRPTIIVSKVVPLEEDGQLHLFR